MIMMKRRYVEVMHDEKKEHLKKGQQKKKKEKRNSRENARKKERKLGDIASGMMRKNKFEKIIRKKR